MNPVVRAIAAWKERGFDYGTTDCCQFCDFVVHQLTGDHKIPWTYSGEDEANKIMGEHGGLEGAVTSVLGEPINNPQAGNVVMWEVKGLQGLGIYLGFDLVATVLDQKGLCEIPFRYVIRSWV